MNKAFALILAIASVAIATTFTSENTQQPFDLPVVGYPGFDLDLNERRLIQLEGQEPVWVTELDKINLKADGINFFDITETQDLGFSAHLRSSLKPTYPAPNASDLVLPVLKTLSTDGPYQNLETLTGFRTRYYRSDTGRESQLWLFNKITEITSKYASESLQESISISEFSHSWPQNSIIVRINGSSATDDRAVIIGAHQDSTNMWPFLPAPGADDDGSGTVTILESYRALIAADFRPVRPVEFHWYSAEEGGLLGSSAIAQDYEKRSVNVYAMSQFDMTAWVKKGTKEVVGTITDFVDSGLTAFNKELITTYLDIPYAETKCGYACSDHASWGKAGYPSVFTIESTFEDSNKFIHSTKDTMDVSDEFSFTHMLEFSKLAVAFAIELGGWKKN